MGVSHISNTTFLISSSDSKKITCHKQRVSVFCNSMMNSFSNAACGNLPVFAIKTVDFAEVAGNGSISPYAERAVLGVSPFFSLPVGGS